MFVDMFYCKVHMNLALNHVYTHMQKMSRKAYILEMRGYISSMLLKCLTSGIYINVPYKLVQLLFHLMLVHVLKAKMKSRMEPSTSPDGTVKEPLADVEVVAAVLCRGNQKPNFLKNIGVVPSHKSVPKFQLQLQLDSQKKGGRNLSLSLMSTTRRRNMLTQTR